MVDRSTRTNTRRTDTTRRWTKSNTCYRRQAADTHPDTGPDRTGHPHDTADTRTGRPDTAADIADQYSIPPDIAQHYTNYLSTHGKPPSARKLAAIAGIGKTTASGHLKKLKENTK